MRAAPRRGLRPPAAIADRQKLRRLELAAGAPVRKGTPSGVSVTHQKMRQAEKELARQAQVSYERTVRDWKPETAGASVTAERA